MSASTILFIFVWLLCGFIHYGLCVGHFQTKYKIIAEENFFNDRLLAAIGILFGPLALFATVIVCRPFNWKL